jgi:hypothetical protein
MVFAVEQHLFGDLKVSVMFAGLHGQPVNGTTWSWDGYDYVALRTQILDPRASVWFK